MARIGFIFEEGDRVLERPRNTSVVDAPRTLALEIRAKSLQRKGTIVECLIKKNEKNQNIKYCKVLWDGAKSPSLHAQHRLTPLNLES